MGWVRVGTCVGGSGTFFAGAEVLAGSYSLGYLLVSSSGPVNFCQFSMRSFSEAGSGKVVASPETVAPAEAAGAGGGEACPYVQ